MSRVKLFDKIRNQVKPIMTNDDLGFTIDLLDLKVYHPAVLPQESSLIIFDGQTTVGYLSDVVTAKQTELDVICEIENPDTDNLNQRKAKVREIQELNLEISSQIYTYIEALAKLQPGELTKKIGGLYKKIAAKVAEKDKDSDSYSEFLLYPQEKFASDIFAEINIYLSDYNTKQLGTTENSTTTQKN